MKARLACRPPSSARTVIASFVVALPSSSVRLRDPHNTFKHIQTPHPLLHFSTESDFYRTAEGRKYFADQITSIRFCVQVTCNYDVLFSYLTTEQYDFKYDLKKSLLPRRNLRASMRHEIETFAAVQKEGRGFDRIIEIAKARMARYGVKPNMLVLAPETELYVTVVPNERITFYEGGDRAVTEFKEGVEGFQAKNFRDLGVVTSTPFDSGDSVDAVQMLNRSTQVGEYYTMRAPDTWNLTMGLASNYMDILVFDEPTDKLHTITFEQGIRAARPWLLHDNTVKAPTVLLEAGNHFGWAPANTRMSPGGSWYNMMERSLDALKKDESKLDLIAKYMPGYAGATNGGAQRLLVTMARIVAALGTGASWYTQAFWTGFLVDVVQAGLWIPIRIVITRSFIEHHMLSAIMAVAGRDTGVTLFGPADMQISANTTVKVIEGHYTCHVKSTITRPQNVLILRDIQALQYVAGSGVRFFGEGNGTVAYDPADFQGVEDDMNARLNFENEENDNYMDMLAFVAPFEQKTGSSSDVAFSLSQMEVPWDVGRQGVGNHENFPGGTPFYNRYDSLMNLNRTLVQGVDPINVQNREFVRNGAYNNSFCFPGPYRSYSPFDSVPWQLNPGQGHWGPDAVPGDGRWRRGEAVSMESARNALHAVDMFKPGGIGRV